MDHFFTVGVYKNELRDFLVKRNWHNEGHILLGTENEILSVILTYFPILENAIKISECNAVYHLSSSRKLAQGIP